MHSNCAGTLLSHNSNHVLLAVTINEKSNLPKFALPSVNIKVQSFATFAADINFFCATVCTHGHCLIPEISSRSI